ncbi:MAG: hypothetical protein WC450_09775 [Candidatus Omnitrophota bacterium]|jgi:hypothetical protein
MNQLYGVEIPSLLLQFMIQTPFIVFIFRMVKRRISRPERPLMNKVESLSLMGVILLYYLGSIFPIFTSEEGASLLSSKEVHWGIMVYSLTLFGYAGVAMATPSYLLFMKGWKKAQKLGQKTPGLWTDHGGNMIWLLGFSGILALTVMAWGRVFDVGLIKGVLCGGFILSFPWFFGQLLEYFNLARPKQNRLSCGFFSRFSAI